MSIFANYDKENDEFVSSLIVPVFKSLLTAIAQPVSLQLSGSHLKPLHHRLVVWIFSYGGNKTTVRNGEHIQK